MSLRRPALGLWLAAAPLAIVASLPHGALADVPPIRPRPVPPPPAPPPLAAPAAPTSDEAAIRALLEAQRTAWNRGDLAGYMAGYLESPALTFFGGARVTRGWRETLDRYRKRYQGEGKAMGQLAFDDVEVVVLSGDAAFVRGAWRLTFPSPGAPGGKDAGGLFTLLLRRLPGGWKIVHDHSS